MKPIRIVLCITLMLALAACVQAGEGKKNKKKNGTKGVVTRVEAGGKSFSMRAGKKKDATAQEVSVLFNDQTKFTKRSKDGVADASSGDLAVGKRVLVIKDDKNLASSITIVDGRKKKNKA